MAGYYAVFGRERPEQKTNHFMQHAAQEIFEVELGQLLLANNVVKVIVFDVESEEIIKWLS